jgi:hypothetical protein
LTVSTIWLALSSAQCHIGYREKEIETMKSVTYKGCTITETGSWTNDQRGRALPLYRITGRYEKAEGLRPFITSIKGARGWIADGDLQAEIRRSYPGPRRPWDADIEADEAARERNGQ